MIKNVIMLLFSQITLSHPISVVVAYFESYFLFV